MSDEYDARPSREAVLLGRLHKRIAKLVKQRDHWKAEYESLSAFFKIYPYINIQREEYEKRQSDTKRLRELEVSQAALINQLERYQKGAIK